ncbi:MAG: parallel beta-helix domain-containing protein [Polyangiaceae bacterium]
MNALARLSTCALLVVFAAGCSDEAVPAGGGTGGGGNPDCAATLTPGADDQSVVQTALIEASAGDTLCFAAGTFSFQSELSLSASDVILRGAGIDETVLDFVSQTTGANGMVITGDRVTVESLTAKNTPGDGIRATDVEDITFRDVAVRWDAAASTANGAYGLYPVGSSGVRIEGCVVNGARDAGIYVGQSERILVTGSEAHGNVAGIEIENSTDAEVVDNHVHDNTGGLLVFNLPGLPVQDGKRANVHQNIVENNNLKSFAEAGTVVAAVPPGIGILILASDDNEIHDNEIRNNRSVGFVLLNYTTALFEPHNDPDFDGFPQGNYIHDNLFDGNGTDADVLVAALTTEVPVPAIMDDGCVPEDTTPGPEDVNCFWENVDAADAPASYYDFNLCGDGDKSSDIAPVTCQHDALPSQDP